MDKLFLISGHSGRETPGLIPNPEVKTASDFVCTVLLNGAALTLLIAFLILLKQNQKKCPAKTISKKDKKLARKKNQPKKIQDNIVPSQNNYINFYFYF